MAHNLNVACNEYYCEVKQELVNDDNDPLKPTEPALWLTQGGKQEENFKEQTYKEELYENHVIKEELVLGPEVLQQPDPFVTSAGTETGAPCPGMQHTDNEKINKLDKEIRDVKSVESEAHLKVHSKEKPYACPHCQQKFGYSSGLKRHLRTHTGEKPYTCAICMYTCSLNSNLKVHMRTHTGKKPYACKYCKCSCSRRSQLKAHLRTHTGFKKV